MDLSFARFDRAEPAGSWVDLPVLMVAASARQAASRTAAAQAELGRPAPHHPFAPRDGRFNADAARALAEWKGG